MKTKEDLRDSVSRETFERLEGLEALLLKWNPKINLIARNDLPRMWNRHILDSVQVFHHAHHPYRNWLDFGSGGGFPGLVCAILTLEQSSEVNFQLVESDSRKAVFLRQAAFELGLNVMIRAERIESLKAEAADVISARALASLTDLLRLCEPHLAPQTQLLFPKGRKVEAELTQAGESWEMEVERIPSLTDPEATILRLTGVSARP